MTRWDETWQRLQVWTNGQGPSERLSAQVLQSDGYTELDPSHPLGGKDGGRDAACVKDGRRWVMAVYFPRGQQDFTTIRNKFVGDLKGVSANGADGIVFVTNQELRLGERKELEELGSVHRVELYHLERVTAILDKPEMAPVRRQFLDIDDGTSELTMLGGIGGLAMGAGGGGGAALGPSAVGGAGGPGGNIRLGGQPGQAPGAGGGGAGAFGDNALAGDGGGGGELAVGMFRAEDLPPTVEITIGEGGRGGGPGTNGQDGGDTAFGNLVRAAGGEGGQAGRHPTRCVTQDDLKAGLRICGVYVADCVHVRNGLLDILSGGWEHYEVSELPSQGEWPVAVTVAMGSIESGAILEFAAIVADPAGKEVARRTFQLSRGDGGQNVLRHWIGTLSFSAERAGLWSVGILSGGTELGMVPIEVKLRR